MEAYSTQVILFLLVLIRTKRFYFLQGTIFIQTQKISLSLFFTLLYQTLRLCNCGDAKNSFLLSIRGF